MTRPWDRRNDEELVSPVCGRSPGIVSTVGDGLTNTHLHPCRVRGRRRFRDEFAVVTPERPGEKKLVTEDGGGENELRSTNRGGL